MKNRTLYFGDNLEIIEKFFPDDFFDLIYLDPPFNSNRDYNILFEEKGIVSSAQIRAFEDTWEWTQSTLDLFNALKNNTNPEIAILIQSLSEFVGQNQMMAYLVNMTARIIPLYRVLKKTGTIYLHCDPTASHYLKIILDVIFGKKNYRNEIIWCYAGGGIPKKDFPRKHDVIFRYTKSDDYFFQHEYRPYGDWTKKFEPRHSLSSGGKKLRKEGTPVNDWWDDLPKLTSYKKEWLGYPTQKPESLLERIIKTSSKENDWVLDPFCGCGTTVSVAERLKRRWIGIDISMLAINVIKKRLLEHYPTIKIDIDGIPKDFESACKLANKDKFAFQDWAISLVGANPPAGKTKKGADKGIDGIILFEEIENNTNKLKKIIVQVKGGSTGRGDIAKLKGDMERENSPLGVFITLYEPSKEMVKEANLAGFYKNSFGIPFPRIQILSIKNWFQGQNIKLPTTVVNPFKRAENKELIKIQDGLF